VCIQWPDHRVEQYLSNQLSAQENQLFELHLLACRTCQEQIDDEVNSLLALRRAALGPRIQFAYA
jgi:hypothetical protein